MPVSKLDGAGWRNIWTDAFVAEDDAFNYAIKRCVKNVPEGFRDIEWTQEFKEMLVEWFFSDNWIKED